MGCLEIAPRSGGCQYFVSDPIQICVVILYNIIKSAITS